MKKRLVCVFAFIVISASGGAVAEERISSAVTAKIFYDIGYDLYTRADAGSAQARQALVFFNAAKDLDRRSDYMLADIINIAWKYPGEDYSEAVIAALDGYIERDCDLEIASKGVSYLVERLDSREQREELLSRLVKAFGNRNSRFASNLWMRLGFLRSETADAQQAQGFLMRAVSADKYNRLAFAKMAELSAIGGEELPDILYLRNLRYLVTANPFDFDSAYGFARYCDSLGLFEPAAAAYEYCSELNSYLSGSDNLQASLYLPWMLSSYNAGKLNDCKEILSKVRSQGKFDPMAEAFGAAAALKRSNQVELETILNGLEKQAEKILAGEVTAQSADYEKFAWFYGFLADAEPEKMLLWATKAYETDPDSALAGSLFAYALLLNSQDKLAAEVVEKVKATTQVAALAEAKILIEKGDTDKAIEILQSSISASPGSFESQKARTMLENIGSEFSYFIEPDIFNTALKSDFGPSFFSEFATPKERLALKLSSKGTVFSYGSDMKIELIVMNHHPEPLVISDGGFFAGKIRVDVRISGDVSMEIPNFITKTVRPSGNIAKGQALFIPLQLVCGQINTSLTCFYPQADLDIEFTAYIDPVETSDGSVKNGIDLPPAKLLIKRRKLDLTTQYLQQRLDSLKKGHQGQKIKSAQLFAGLLAEQQHMRKQPRALYRFREAAPELLSSAIVRCITEDDWVLKAHAISAVRRVELDYNLAKAVSRELDNDYWPVRLITIFVLGQNGSGNIAEVLEYAVNHEENQLVKNMATLLLSELKADSDFEQILD